MSYNVVFEHDESNGGLYGCRTLIPFSHKEAFEKRTFPKKNIVAQDISDKEAKNLIALCPEVCRLMGIIEQSYQEDPKIGIQELRIKIDTINTFVIKSDRIYIEENSLTRIDARKYIAHYRKMIADDPMSFKTASMQGIMMVLLNKYTGEML